MNKFWEGQKVIVTGGAGMVGSFLCPMLKDKGADVTVLTPSLHDKKLIDGVAYIKGDASDINVCGRVFADADTVFNLAARVGGVYYNAGNQRGQLWDNLMLQIAPLIAARQCEVKNFLQVSSVCVYADEYNNPAIEKNGFSGEPRPANAGYAWAKRLGERATHLVFEATDTKYVIVRPTNMYGEGDNFGIGSHVVPALIRKFVDGESPIVVYNGESQREFMHAEDGARGMIEALEEGKRGETYNLGTGGETKISIKALACMIDTLTEANVTMQFVDDSIQGDQERCTDCSKARQHFIWFHRIDLVEGLYRTIEHYRSKVSCQKQCLVVK